MRLIQENIISLHESVQQNLRVRISIQEQITTPFLISAWTQISAQVSNPIRDSTDSVRDSVGDTVFNLSCSSETTKA